MWGQDGGKNTVDYCGNPLGEARGSQPRLWDKLNVSESCEARGQQSVAINS